VGQDILVYAAGISPLKSAAFETFCTQSPFGRNSIVVNYKN